MVMHPLPRVNEIRWGGGTRAGGCSSGACSEGVSEELFGRTGHEIYRAEVGVLRAWGLQEGSGGAGAVLLLGRVAGAWRLQCAGVFGKGPGGSGQEAAVLWAGLGGAQSDGGCSCWV